MKSSKSGSSNTTNAVTHAYAMHGSLSSCACNSFRFYIRSLLILHIFYARSIFCMRIFSHLVPVYLESSFCVLFLWAKNLPSFHDAKQCFVLCRKQIKILYGWKLKWGQTLLKLFDIFLHKFHFISLNFSLSTSSNINFYYFGNVLVRIGSCSS